MKTPEAAAIACEECGQPDAQEIGEHILCAECIVVAASACAGGQSDDE